MVMMKKIYLSLLIGLLLATSSMLAAPVAFIPSLLSGTEMQHLGYKFANNSGVILSTRPIVSCDWKPDRIDDGWATCETIIEIENQNAVSRVLSTPNLIFSFRGGLRRNAQLSYSNTSTLVTEEYLSRTPVITLDGDIDEVREDLTFSKRNFTFFTSIPATISTARPFALRLAYETPKYSTTSFTFTLRGADLTSFFIDPLQSSCGTLSSPGTYTLTQNINTAGTCFTINSNHVILDGAGYTITGNRSGSGISNTGGYDNLTIRSFGSIANFSYGVDAVDMDNSTIYNNSIILADGLINSRGIAFASSNGNNISQNSLRLNGSGAVLIQTENSRLNTISYNSLNATQAGDAVTLISTNSTTFSSNNISGFRSDGLGITGYSNLITLNNITSTIGQIGIEFALGANNTVSFNTITLNPGDGILITNTNNSEIVSNTISTVGSSSTADNGIILRYASYNTRLINNNITSGIDNEISDETGDIGVNYLIYNNTFGEIRWIDNGTGSFLQNLTLNVTNNLGLGLDRTIFIGNNTASLNTSAFGTNHIINSTANITLRGVEFNNQSQIMKLSSFTTSRSEITSNGASCEGISCQLLNQSQGTVIFNTSSFSSFAVSLPLEVDVYNLSLAFANSTQYTSLLFFMKNPLPFTNSFNWNINTEGITISSTVQTDLTANETMIIFVERNYGAAGVYTIIANGTTANRRDSEQKEVTVG